MVFTAHDSATGGHLADTWSEAECLNQVSDQRSAKNAGFRRRGDLSQKL